MRAIVNSIKPYKGIVFLKKIFCLLAKEICFDGKTQNNVLVFLNMTKILCHKRLPLLLVFTRFAGNAYSKGASPLCYINASRL